MRQAPASFPRRRGFGIFKRPWMPACAGMAIALTFTKRSILRRDVRAGRRSTTGNRVCRLKRHRGFESHSLRHPHTNNKNSKDDRINTDRKSDRDRPLIATLYILSIHPIAHAHPEMADCVLDRRVAFLEPEALAYAEDYKNATTKIRAARCRFWMGTIPKNAPKNPMLHGPFRCVITLQRTG